jgi:hypothetical protein
VQKLISDDGQGNDTNWNRFQLVSGQEGNLDRQQEDEKIKGSIGKVSSVGFGAEYEWEDAAQKVGTTILFRHIHSGDVKSASEKYWLHTSLQLRCFIVCALYGTRRLNAHS